MTDLKPPPKTTMYGNRVLLIQRDSEGVEWVGREYFEHSRELARQLYEALGNTERALTREGVSLKYQQTVRAAREAVARFEREVDDGN